MRLDKFFNVISEVGSAIFQAFAWPGEYVILHVSRLLPDLGAYLSTPTNHTTAVVILSLVYWYLVVVLLAIFTRACRNISRIVMATARTLVFRFMLKIASIKTKIICKYRHRIPAGNSRDSVEHSMAEYDKLDLAILKALAMKGPGFALSAPELAEMVSLLPAEVQRSLDKLNGHAMIESVIGSTDGYDNYRLTEVGNAFIGVWLRQQRRESKSTAASPAWA
jgi:DNA-binding MarR family transcriptional regulator